MTLSPTSNVTVPPVRKRSMEGRCRAGSPFTIAHSGSGHNEKWPKTSRSRLTAHVDEQVRRAPHMTLSDSPVQDSSQLEQRQAAACGGSRAPFESTRTLLAGRRLGVEIEVLA